jgi:hypothetical protein
LVGKIWVNPPIKFTNFRLLSSVGAGLLRLFVGRRNLDEPPTKITALRLLPSVGAGLLRLFVGRRNLGEPAPTKS